jgi:hypothetical protein
MNLSKRTRWLIFISLNLIALTFAALTDQSVIPGWMSRWGSPLLIVLAAYFSPFDWNKKSEGNFPFGVNK